MSDRTAQAPQHAAAPPDGDIGEYCRRVEEHLARVNEGHLVRVVGVGFELVRGWAVAGVPLSVVCRGIDQKAERHRAGASRRPLRVEFCAHDVQALYADWRRAVGVMANADADPDAERLASTADDTNRRRPSLTKHIDRATERLVRAAGRLDLPERFRESLTTVLEQLVVLREQAAHARGDVKATVAARVAALDDQVMAAARLAADASLAELRQLAEEELAVYRGRLSGDAFQRGVQASVDRLLRDRFALPTLDPEA